MKLAEILTGPETWIQGNYTDGLGRRCLLGALHRLAGEENWFTPEALKRERKRLALVIGIKGIKSVHADQVAKWNDNRARTWDEVSAVVDAYDRDRMLHP